MRVLLLKDKEYKPKAFSMVIFMFLYVFFYRLGSDYSCFFYTFDVLLIVFLALRLKFKIKIRLVF
ncbi:hypothetical protein DBL01_03155 [Acinetobacter pittii]|nr:hypothetical protein DBL01_03155 [Acinetobacter pittii]